MLFPVVSSQATDYIFTGTATAMNQNWTDANKWKTLPTDDATFPNAAGDFANIYVGMRTNKYISNNIPITIGSLWIGDVSNKFKIQIWPGSGGSLSFAGATNPATISKFTNTTDTIVSDITLRTNLLVTNYNGTLVISGSIGQDSSARGIAKYGTGTLTLQSANTFSGGFTNAAGRTRIADNTAVGTGTFSLNGGTVSSDSTSAYVLPNNFVLGGNVTLGHRVQTGQLTFTGSGTLDGNRTLTISNEIVFSGAIGQNGGPWTLTKIGGEDLTLGGANTFANLALSNGTVRLAVDPVGTPGHIVSSGVGTNRLSFFGGRLSSDSASPRDILSEVLFENGGGTSAYLGDSTPMDGGLRFRGPATLTSGRNLQVQSPVIYEGAIGESGGSCMLTKRGPGTLTLSGNNTFTGGLTIDQGEVVLDHTGALNSSSPNAVVFTENANNKFLSLHGVSVTAGGLTGTNLPGDSCVRNNGSGPALLTIQVDSGAFVYAGRMEDGAAGGTLAITKTGLGAQALVGPSSYSGATLVSAGELILSAQHTGGGPITVNDNAGLGVQGAEGATLLASSLSLGNTTNTTLNFDLAAMENPAVPMVYATNLSVAATSIVNVTGLGLSVGQFTLIQYENTIGGAGFAGFQLGTLPAGVKAQLVDNGSNHSVDLLITETETLTWTGKENSLWDVAASTNWDWLGTETTYQGGKAVFFPPQASNYNIVIPANIVSGFVTVENDAAAYTFSGAALEGNFRLTKRGPGTLFLQNSNNNYSAGTAIKAGTIQIGANQVLPRDGAVTITSGSLNIGTNSQTIGALLGGGEVFVGAGGSLTVTSEVFTTFSGRISGAGGFAKSGSGVLTLAGLGEWSGGTLIDGGALKLGAPNSLPSADIGVAAGALLDLGGSGPVVTLGGLSGSGTVDKTVGTNTCELVIGNNNASTIFSGTIQNSAGTLVLAKMGTGQFTLNGTNSSTGDTLVEQGTLKLGASEALSTSPNIHVQDGACLDVSAPTGGFKINAGQLLFGSGSVTGAVTIGSNAQLAVEAEGGTFRFTDNLTVLGNVSLNIHKSGSTVSADKIAVGKTFFVNDGFLTVSLTGDSLTGGEVFDLFDAGSFNGMFYSVNLPPLGAGLTWQLNQLFTDGTISVNRLPVAGHLSILTTTHEAVTIPVAGLLVSCSDADGDTLSIIGANAGSHGSANLRPEDATITYYPVADYTGSDQFTYIVSDGNGGTSVGTVDVLISDAGAPNHNRISEPAKGPSGIEMDMAGIPGRVLILQRSTNFIDWVNISTNSVPLTGALTFTDPTLPSPPPPMVFYRARYILDTPQAIGEQVVDTAQVQGGLIVHVGAGDGKLTAALRRNQSFLVHGLERDAAKVALARDYIRGQALYGPVSVEQWTGSNLPYVDGFANLVVLEDPGLVTSNEVWRVLAPLGKASRKEGSNYVAFISKPWPTNIDEWTHYLHDAAGTCVANDTVAGPPRRLQWTAGPRFSRHHDVTSSYNSSVTAGGRFFYIIDDGSRLSILLPSSYSLYARDAFNGTLLWKRSISSWHPNMYGYKSGPTQLTKRLVAIGNVVYTPLDYYGPLNALDAATGATIRTYDQTAALEEVIYSDGVLFAMVNPTPQRWAAWQDYYETGTGLKTPNDYWNNNPRIIMAIDAATGANLWQVQGSVYPGSFAADASGFIYHDGTYMYKLDRHTGTQLWRSSTTVPVLTPWYTAFGISMILYKDTVLMTDGKNNIVSVDSNDGTVLATWPHDKNSINNAPRDLFLVDDLVWSTASATSDPICKGYDRRTGSPVKTNDPGINITWIHQRCHRNKATVNWFITSRCGTEFINTQTGEGEYNDWTRGACLYGIIPANGFVYGTPNNCACFYEMKLSGLNAQYADTNYPAALDDSVRLQPGPAYGEYVPTSPAANDWPTYRHDWARSGYTTDTLPAALNDAWQAQLGGKLSGLTLGEGRLLVSSINTHTVLALNPDTGAVLWSFMTGGRVDSPPTIYQGRVIFGCADGYVYCLRATDGALIWRFLAAPTDLRITSYEQVESVWPVIGSTLIFSNKVVVVSGRSMFLDGGLHLLMLNPTNGVKLSETVMDNTVPSYNPKNPGMNLQSLDLNLTGPVGLPDILSSDGQYFYMKSQQFNPDGSRTNIGPVSATDNVNTAWTNQIGPGVHLFTIAGFTDDLWVHRVYWVYGKRYSGGAGGYSTAGKHAPCGQILCVDENNVYGYGRKQQYYQWTRPKENMLFCTPNTNAFVNTTVNPFTWTNTLPFMVRAMAVAGDRLYIAGPPDVEDEQLSYTSLNAPQTQMNLTNQVDALNGLQGGQFRIVDKWSGTTLAMYNINWLPSMDGMIAAKGRIYVSTLDGRVICLQ